MKHKIRMLYSIQQLWVCCILLLLSNTAIHSQTSPLTLSFDAEVGCGVSDGGHKAIDFTEDITDGPCIKVCEGNIVNYSLTGNSGEWTNLNWSVTGGTISNIGSGTMTVHWGSIGGGTISVDITLTNGAHTIRTACIEIITSPTASFAVFPQVLNEPIYACVDVDMYFTNLSTTNGGSALASYYWEFSDGTTSTEFQPVHHFTEPSDDAWVTLTVTNECNCTSVITIPVFVKEKWVSIACPSVVCEGEKATYSLPNEINELCPENLWSVIGGEIVSEQPYGNSIDVVWNQVDENGFGYVTFDSTKCDLQCRELTSIRVPVVQTKGTIQGETTVCEKKQYRYKLPQWPTTDFVWELNDPDGTGATLIYTDQRNEIVLTPMGPGTIELKAVYRNTLLNCGGTATMTIHIKATGNIIGETVLCVGQTTYSLLEGFEANWVLNGPNGFVQTQTGTAINGNFTAAGNYVLSVSGADFCSPELFAITVSPQPAQPEPITGFFENVCPGTPVTYSVTNSVSGTIMNWSVSGGTIIGSNYGNEITAIFAGAGPYQVSVKRENTDAPHCVSLSTDITVTAPVVQTTITGSATVCSSSDQLYQVAYLGADNYSWSIQNPALGSVISGNGTQNATFLWNNVAVPTNTNIVLKIRKCGLDIPFTYAVTIIPTANVTFQSPAQVCGGEFVAPAINPGLTSYGTVNWDFGDGYTYSGLTPDHYYTNFGDTTLSYTITLTITQPNGCVIPLIISHPITVLPKPKVHITPDINRSFCYKYNINLPLTVNNQSGVGSPFTIQWFINGNVQSLLTNQTTIYPNQFGDYYAEVSNSFGCTSRTNTTSIIQMCSSDPCTTAPNPNLVMTASLSSCGIVTAAAGYGYAPLSYSWYAGPTATVISSGISGAQFSFPDPGVYTILYTAEYPSTTPGVNCTLSRISYVTVPYIADLKTSIHCGAGTTGYDVTLFDYSAFYPSTPITQWEFVVDGLSQGVNNTNNAITVVMAPGMHTVTLNISGGGYVCSKTITVDLPNLPDAHFTADALACYQNKIHFTANDSSPGLTYLWTFEPSITNSQQNPDRVFTTPGFKAVMLTVTNQYGCSVSWTNNFPIEIKANRLGGSIIASPSVACAGSTIELQYNPNSFTVNPTAYHWMQGNQQIGFTTHPVNTFSVNTSGSYWVWVEGQYGCKWNDIQPIAATFVPTPVVAIKGPTSVCQGQLAIFHAYAGDSPEVAYRWSLNGVWQNTFSTYNTAIGYTFSTSGVYNFIVEVRVDTGSGQYCYAQSTHTVTVLDMPVITALGFDPASIVCNPYSVNLFATANVPGTFTWSNGMSGNNITVNSGGPYMVRFTSAGGCSVTAQLDVPKDPEVYLWIFPSGCYDLCSREKEVAGILIGPAAVFPHWAWFYNAAADTSGSGTEPDDYEVTETGTYNLQLNNGYCTKTSRPMNVTLQDCRCELVMEQPEITAIKGENQFCFYQLDFYVYNPYSYPLVLTITNPSGDGIFQPGTVTLAPLDYTAFTVNMIPLNSFNGGNLTLAFQTDLEEGKLCRSELLMEFPTLCVDEQFKQANGNDMLRSSLLIAPNPAKETANIHFNLGSNEADNNSMEVYDLTGRVLQRITLTAQQGILNLDIKRYAAGQYIVVLRSNGTVIQQQNLLIQE